MTWTKGQQRQRSIACLPCVKPKLPTLGTWDARELMPKERTRLRYPVYKSNARRLAAALTAQLQNEMNLAGPQALDLTKVRFEAIDAQALEACQHWEHPQFSWSEIHEWKAREPLALDIAIWFEEELCGLCFVNPNSSRRRIRIVRLEGRPKEAHPLKNRVAMLAIIVIDQYAQLLGSQLIEVQEPLKGAIPMYQQLGFYFDADNRLVMATGCPVS